MSERYVYLLHFSAPVGHAQHYLGSADYVDVRVEEHRAGRGARLTQIAVQRGLVLFLARIWKGDRTRERKMKEAYNHSFRALCPICTPGAGTRRARVFSFEEKGVSDAGTER